jgi:hypothetical protein
MNRAIVIPVILLLLFCCHSVGYSQKSGLRFSGHEVPLDDRTGLNLTPDQPIQFGSTAKLTFELKFQPDRHSYFGYIFRAILDDKNIDLIYTTIPVEGNNFHLVIGDNISNISFSFPLDEITSRWEQITLTISKKTDKISLQLGENTFEDEINTGKGKSKLLLFFGAHNYDNFTSTDLPNMNIRNIEFYDGGKIKYHWPLDQYEGNRVNEVIDSFFGQAENPIWIRSFHRTWLLSDEFYFQGEIKYDFDEKNNDIRIIQQDSMYSYHLGTKQLNSFLPGHGYSPDDLYQLIYDSQNNRFIYYSLDQNMKCLLSETSPCETISNQNLGQPKHWHHSSVINPENGALYTFGGYGQLTYKNEVFSFNDSAGRWDTVSYDGTFYPRYLAGLGYNKEDKKAYILGGYGSRQGKQTINPGYYFDLLRYSFEESRFEMLNEYSEGNTDFCYARSLHIDTASNTLYGLRFSKYEAMPQVQAVAVLLDDYELREVGNTFNFPFLDISSTIDLFYDRVNNQLVSFNTFYENDRTKVTIHRIAYPPISEYASLEISGQRFVLEILLAILLIISGLVIYLIRKQKKKGINTIDAYTTNSMIEENGSDISKIVDTRLQPGSIIIFGGFQIIDAKGKDITSSFTPLLKGLFLYIMIASLRHGKGVSSKSIDEVFWLDKSKQSARNNRSVNILKLKTLLQKVGDCEISKDTGYWKFTFDPSSIFIDFHEYLQIIRKGKLQSKEDMNDLLKIIHRGPALQNINADWLDDIKSELSNEIIDNVLEFIHQQEDKIEPEYIIQIANCVFFFDMISEEAMIYKCKMLVKLGKHSLAKNAYEKFVKEFKVLYDENYAKSFAEVLKS